MTARESGERATGPSAPLFLATLPSSATVPSGVGVGAGDAVPEVRCDAGQVVVLPDDDRLVRVLAGEHRPPGTRIVLAGRRLDRLGAAARVRRGLAVVGGTEVADDVSVRDHLAAVVGGRAARSLLAAAPLLAHRGDDPAGVLSGGERRVLGWLQAQAAQPRAVLLDRAGTGLDDAALRWAHEAVDRWLAAGTAVLLRPGRRAETAWIAHRADGRPRATNGRV